MKLYDGGVYLVNGSDIVEESKFDQPWHMISWKHTILPEICRNYRSSLIS